MCVECRVAAVKSLPVFHHSEVLIFWVDCLQLTLIYKLQNFRKVVVHVIIIDQCNETEIKTKSRYQLFIAALFLSM